MKGSYQEELRMFYFISGRVEEEFISGRVEDVLYQEGLRMFYIKKG